MTTSTKVWSVQELTHAIRQELEPRFAHICVQGEVSNCKAGASGHCYFTLKDSASQLSAVLFKGNAKALARPLKEGDQILATGEISVYVPRGGYQLVVREVRFAGVGELLLKLHELKALLAKRGWFDEAKKKALPKFPRVIGVVTSPTGAVIQDILNVLRRRYPGFQLLLNPVKVQGEGAAEEIALAIEEFNRHKLADVLIVGRGGGSIEDLWAFNQERVAEAIYASVIPIISAVGHETDFTIADMVADIRAPTPSAAAELAIGVKAHYLEGLLGAHKRLLHTAKSQLKQCQLRLNGAALHPLFKDPYAAFLGQHHQKLDAMGQDIGAGMQRHIAQKKGDLSASSKRKEALKPGAQLLAMHHKLQALRTGVHTAMHQKLHLYKKLCSAATLQRQLELRLLQMVRRKKEQFTTLVSHLQAIDPKNILRKGYCILFSEKKDSIILSRRQVQPSQKVRLLVSDGEIGAIVYDTTATTTAT